jgi:hypothetical protein
MLTKFEEEIVSKYVDEYIDGLRMDVVILDRSRVITEDSDLRITIIDKDFLIDYSREYEIFIRNPVEENLFIPIEISYYETQIVLEFDRKDGFKITNFLNDGVVDSDDVPIDDPRVTDNCLSNLVCCMCFDVRYQKLYPEVKTLIDKFFSTSDSNDFEKLKTRLRPFLGVNESKTS